MFGLSKIIIQFSFYDTISSSILIYSMFFFPIKYCSISWPLRIMSLSPNCILQLFSEANYPSFFNITIRRDLRYFCAETHPIEVFFRQRSRRCPISYDSRGKESYFSMSILLAKEKNGLQSSLEKLNFKFIIIIDMQSDKIIRSAVHAGSWYTNNKAKLLQQLDANLTKAEKRPQIQTRKIKALIGPHAGLKYSGPVAAWAYKYLTNNTKKLRVFLIGPSHYKYLDGVSFSICTELQTPIGNIEVDLQTIKQLRGQIEGVSFSKKDQQKQHSLQMHLPYLRQVLGQNFKVVPIIVGPINDKKVDELGHKLSKYFDDKDTIFVISSDFCHWGQHFSYQPHSNQVQVAIHQHISSLDHRGMSLIEKHDLKGFAQYLNQTKNTICGRNPIKVLLSTIINSKIKLSTNFVQYDQSQNVEDFSQSSVSYASSITYQIQ